MTMTLKIPPEMDARLAAEARRRRVSKSQVAREIIADGLKRKPAQRVSLHDRLKHVCGMARGPGDLATNPKYLEGLGE
jgi:predicted transcriptional regulator